MCDGKLLKVLLYAIVFVLLCHAPVVSQIKWDGGGGDGLWTTAANWAGNNIPAITDEVVLDNTFVPGNYTVTLPSGTVAVTVKTLVIAPGSGHVIELILPETNTAVPAFTVTGPGYGMVLNNGGIFRNASGAGSGLPVMIADSLQIKNGGRYIQNSDGSHAATVTVLSKAPGTEEGIFEFDIRAASNTISLSGRTFGKLVLSSNAQPGIVTYTGTGANGATINSDLEMQEGVNVSLNLSDTLLIKRDLIQRGGMINLGNAGRTLVTVIGRHIVQHATGLIYESGTAAPEIILNGKATQQIDCQGTIQNNVAFNMNNSAGAELMAPLSLPYLLKLQKGKITTTADKLLTLSPGCQIQADSVSGTSFINGPLRVEGLSATAHFLIPVGKDDVMRWLALKNATGNYTVTFVKGNPKLISSTYSTGLDHISVIEYWTMQTDAIPAPSAALELSFNDPNSGGVTDLSTLRVGWLNNNTWMNAGNTGVTGSAGSRGSVISSVISNMGSGTVYFTLGSSMPETNPLPLREDTLPRNIYNDTADDFRLRLVSFSGAAQMLTCRSPEKSSIAILVYNMSGTLVRTITVKVEKGMNRIRLPMPTLPAGLYRMLAFSYKRRSNVLQFVIL